MKILKKAFPQFVINSFFGLLFIFVFALIGVLHTNEVNAEEKVEILDWTAQGFITKLTKQCPHLIEQAPDVLEIATKLAKMADERRLAIRQDIKTDLKSGLSKFQARKRAEFYNPILPLRANHPKVLGGPSIPYGLPASEWSEWQAEQDRIEYEKKQDFTNSLKCPQIPDYLLELSYTDAGFPGKYTDKKQ